jgi:hypothetical protein
VSHAGWSLITAGYVVVNGAWLARLAWSAWETRAALAAGWAAVIAGAALSRVWFELAFGLAALAGFTFWCWSYDRRVPRGLTPFGVRLIVWLRDRERRW